MANRQQWPEFTPAPGDVLDCVATNTPTAAANLSITKNSTPGANEDIDQTSEVTQGTSSTYALVILNNGPVVANDAVVRDTPAAG